jgi:H+-transporting ATPase
MPVLMLMLITLLNDGTLITIGYDLAVAPKTPPIWNMPFLFSMAFVQSFVAMISSLFLLQNARTGVLERTKTNARNGRHSSTCQC